MSWGAQNWSQDAQIPSVAGVITALRNEIMDLDKEELDMRRLLIHHYNHDWHRGDG